EWDGKMKELGADNPATSGFRVRWRGVKRMATPSSSYDVIIIGSGIAGLTGALAAHELGCCWSARARGVQPATGPRRLVGGRKGTRTTGLSLPHRGLPRLDSSPLRDTQLPLEHPM